MDENFNINPDIVDQDDPPAPRDPFADEWGGIAFVNDTFKLDLNKLLHLVPYSEVLLLNGPQGVGKSTLLHQFVVAAKKGWKAVHVHSSSLMTTEEFLRQIVHGFGLPSAGVDEVEEMLVEIGRYLQALGRSGRRAIVVIDDAHLLADEVLVMVEHILSDERSANAISLVLGMDDEGAASRLDNFPVLLHKLAYTLKMEPLAETDVANYIHHRLAHSGNLAAEPLFGGSVIKQLYSKSGGLPGKINELARHHLNRKSGGVAVSGSALVKWGVALVGVAVVGAVLLFQDRINQMVAVSPKAPEAVTELAMPAEDETAVVTEGKESVALERAAEEKGESAEVSPDLNMGELSTQPEAQAPEAAPSAAAEAVTQAPAKVEEPKSAPAPVSPEPRPAAPAAEPKPAPVAPAPVSKPAEVAPPKPVAKAPPKSKEKGWLQSQNPQHFTLQLMALLDEAEVRQFVKKHKLQGQSEIFFITRNGKRLTALVYGSYPDRPAIDAAAAALPKEWGVSGAWPRTFASVLEEAKAAR